MKQKITVDWAKSQANELKIAYPHLTNANEIINQAMVDGLYENNTQYLAVWGRLNRLFR